MSKLSAITVHWFFKCKSSINANYHICISQLPALGYIQMYIYQGGHYWTVCKFSWHEISYSGPGLHSFSAGVAPPLGVLQSSGYQYPLPHGGGGGHQLTFTPLQLVQQGMRLLFNHMCIILPWHVTCGWERPWNSHQLLDFWPIFYSNKRGCQSFLQLLFTDSSNVNHL